MSNEYVIASAQFLKESWYRENAGTPEAQESKLLEQIFEEIIDYCVECGMELDESVEIANEIIEEDLIEEFYEEFLNEQGMMDVNAARRERQRVLQSRTQGTTTTRIAPSRWTAEGPTGPNRSARPYGAPGTVRQSTTVNRRWGEGMPAGPGERGYNPTAYNTARSRVAAQRANVELRGQLRTRDAGSTQTPSTRRSTVRPVSVPSTRPSSLQTTRPTIQGSGTVSGARTVSGQGTATQTGSLPREPQAPFDRTRPIIRSIFKDPSKPLQ